MIEQPTFALFVQYLVGEIKGGKTFDFSKWIQDLRLASITGAGAYPLPPEGTNSSFTPKQTPSDNSWLWDTTIAAQDIVTFFEELQVAVKAGFEPKDFNIIDNQWFITYPEIVAGDGYNVFLLSGTPPPPTRAFSNGFSNGFN